MEQQFKNTDMKGIIEKHPSCYSIEFDNGAKYWSMYGEPESAFIERVREMVKDDFKKGFEIVRK